MFWGVYTSMFDSLGSRNTLLQRKNIIESQRPVLLIDSTSRSSEVDNPFGVVHRHIPVVEIAQVFQLQKVRVQENLTDNTDFSSCRRIIGIDRVCGSSGGKNITRAISYPLMRGEKAGEAA